MVTKNSRGYNIFYLLLCLFIIVGLFLLPTFLRAGHILIDHSLLQCMILSEFHIYCPGCGGTRGMLHLFQGNIIKSLLYNPISLFLVIVFILFFIDATKKFVAPVKHRWLNYKLVLIIAIMLIFYTFIIRNILAVYFHIDYIGVLIK